MMDVMDWMGGMLIGAIMLLVAGVLLVLAGGLYLSVQCYRSGDPDSIACYMANGKTSRIKADVSVK